MSGGDLYSKGTEKSNRLSDTPVDILVMKQVAVEYSILIKLNWLAQQQKF